MSSPFPKSSSSAGGGCIVAATLPAGGSGLETITYQYPLKLISPSPSANEKSVLVFLLSYGGGLVAGDSVDLSVHVRSGARLSLVTQGHTKVFKSPSAEVVTRQKLELKVDDGAALCLLPDPVQPFEDSVYVQTQIFRTTGQASICFLDWVTQGRSARGENWSFVKWTGRNEVWQCADPASPKDRLLVRDTVILSSENALASGQPLPDTMHKLAVFGTLILRGALMKPVGDFFMTEFDNLPRLGARDFRSQDAKKESDKNVSEAERWRSSRIDMEKRDGVLWSAAHVRGCVVVKFGAPMVEAAREWVGSMLLREGTIGACFGEQALMCVRAPGRGTRRGDAAAGERRPADTNDAAAAEPVAAPGSVERASATPGPSVATRGAPAIRRGTTARASRAAPTTGRFRPKNVRRDEAERDSLARQEEEKARERAAAELRARGRSRFRSKRSRGDAMGSRGGFGRAIIGGASGPFAGGFGGAGGGRFGSRPLGGPGGGGGSFGGSGYARGAKSESNGGRSFNEVDGGRFREPRINADRLHANTPDEDLDSEDEAMMTALGSKTASVLPMGIYRKEHKEEEVVVATTAELEAAENATGEEESLWVDGDGPNAQSLAAQPEEGVWDTDSKPVVIKKEPGTDDFMDLDAKLPTEQEETKPAVELKKKKALPQDAEDQMIQSDLNLLANELGAVTIEADGESKSEGPANKDGRLYLFQFPPVLPPLKHGAMPQPSAKVKAEPEHVNLLDTIASAKDASPVDLTQDSSAGQGTGAGGGDDDGHDELENEHGFMSELLTKGGMIGKLRVRKSGRVELDWGGRTLEMNPAAGMNFLTTAVIVEENDEKPQTGVVGGESIGMGKIMGRFLLAPIWGEEEEWDVDPAELEAGEDR
ncbi:urease accessory protein [Paramyrothecium foliicola]|nr:urease accessory protein [Paramyrothecium foliicola]